MGGKGRPYKPHCLGCDVFKTEENTYKQSKNGNLQSYCKSCDKKRITENKRKKRLGIGPMKKNKRSAVTKYWAKSNKNHYPDPDWVWTQIENGESPASFHEKLEKKYALNKHGNEGKANRWKNKNKNNNIK